MDYNNKLEDGEQNQAEYSFNTNLQMVLNFF